MYPREVDYARERPLGDVAQPRGRACGRPTRRGSAGRPGDGALVYLSLGSLGSADVELMQRLIDDAGRDRRTA